MYQQLKLDFASALASALEEPEQADIAWMCASLDQYLQGRSHHEQLQVAGDAIRDIAEVCYQRAEMLIQDWQNRHNTEGPVLDEDFLAGMVQETMFLDVSELCRQPKSRKRYQGFAGQPVESVVGEVSKAEVLEFVDQVEAQTSAEVALGASHEENVGGWVSAMAYLQSTKADSVSIRELSKAIQLSPIQVWIAGLLGFRLRQTKDFYNFDGVKICLNNYR
ncbi:MAG: hypothetical protein HC790_14155 [Acaryochloridaceae cyanobacterium CSU_3_4]|nr:hypothetical protein [Acaryochloridaceae cyanobacterium CSU_3_4]